MAPRIQVFNFLVLGLIGFDHSTVGKHDTETPGEEPAEEYMDGPELLRPEIVVGLVGALGTPLDDVCDGISQRLRDVGYETDVVRISATLTELAGLAELDALQENLAEKERLSRFMKAGTAVREKLGRGDVLAVLAIGQIRELRHACTNDRQQPEPNRAYVLRSLKHPDEVDTLRHVYGEHFVLVGVGAPREVRVRNVSQRMARSDGRLKAGPSRAEAEHRIAIDEREPETSLGQNVRDTFPLADFFIDGSDASSIGTALDRLLRLMFSDPFVTPSRDETAMFHAKASALRSAALGRQVGAAIVSPDKGDVLAVGMNEVPKAGGGHYWEGDDPDGCDFRLLKDTNDEHKEAIIRQVLKSLSDKKWLTKDLLDKSSDELLQWALRDGGPIRGTWLMSLTEFGRDVHAEMSAIVSAARRGVATQEAHLYCTTFPCHNCAKHIIAAGIRRVVYIEPYAKSFAREFHLDSATENQCAGDGRITFEPFTGVAPRRYVTWFTMPRKRKDKGRAIRWRPDRTLPWCGIIDAGFIAREREVFDRIVRLMERDGINAR